MERPQGAVFVIPIRPRRVVVPLLLLAGLATLLLARKPAEARLAPVPTDPPAELRLVPRDTFFVFHVNVSGVLSKELSKAFLALMPKDGKEDVGVREFGAPLSDIDAIAMMAGKQNHVVVVTTRKAYDSKKVLAALAPKAAENTYKGKVFHLGTSRSWQEQILPYIEDRDIIRDRAIPKDARVPDEFLPKKDGPVPPPPQPPIREFKDREPRKEGDFPRDDFKDRGPGPGPGPGLQRMDPWAPAVYFLSDRTYVTGNARDVMHFIDTAEKPDEKHPLIDALSTAGRHHFTQGVALPEEIAREMKSGLRGEMRHDPIMQMMVHNLRPLLEFRQLFLTADLGDESRLDAVATFPNARNAEKAQDAARFALQLFKGSANMLEEGMAELLGGEDKIQGTKVVALLDAYRAAFNDAVVKTDGSTVKLTLKVKTDADQIKAVLVEFAPKLEHAANKTRSQNNLKQMALALHNYHDSMGQFPPVSALFDRQGKPNGLSWRVHLLPYIEEERLYKEFRFDEPWDSDHNKKLIAKMPKVYMTPGARSKEGMTHYLGIASTGDEVNLTGFPHRPKAGTRIQQITDGTSNTVAIVEAAEPVIWTKPDDILYNSKQKMWPLMGSIFGDGFNAAFYDGSVRFIRKKDAPEESLKALFTTNGGETFTLPFDDDHGPRRNFRDVPRTAPAFPEEGPRPVPPFKDGGPQTTPPRIEDRKPIEKPFDLPPPPPFEKKDR